MVVENIGMERILIVEDDLAMWAAYIARLEKFGHDTRAFNNGDRIE